MTSSGEKVQTNYGPVIGTTRKTAKGKSYHAFFGVPYAKQPFGESRFRDPQPLEPWTDDFDATTESPGSTAYQLNIMNPVSPILSGSDNCLVVNVYTTDVTAKRPVYVWIHGGGFGVGSNSTMFYGPEYFVAEDVVVVAMNYRVGVLGFLSFKDKSLEIPGNAGLKDQSMALRWIKENVASFGGDPDNITVGGESAGGASVHYHLISPMSEGLFNRAFVQSGAAYNSWANMPDDEQYEYELARKLGWDGERGDQGAFAVIESTKIEKVLNTAADLIEERGQELRVFGSGGITSFLPRVEPYESKMCFLPKPLVELGHDAWSKDMDIVIGGMKDEGLLFESRFDECAPMLQKDFSLLIPIHLRRTLNKAERTAAASILKNLYFWKRDVDFKFTSKFVEMIGDLTFWHGIHRVLLQRHYLEGTGKTWHYFLANSIDPTNSFYKLLRTALKLQHDNGSAHGDDLILTWKSMFDDELKPDSKVYGTHKRFFGSLISFVKTGDPNHAGLGVKWKTIEQSRESDAEMFSCLKFTDDGVDLVPAPYQERLLVWDSIYEMKDLI